MTLGLSPYTSGRSEETELQRAPELLGCLSDQHQTASWGMSWCPEDRYGSRDPVLYSRTTQLYGRRRQLSASPARSVDVLFACCKTIWTKAAPACQCVDNSLRKESCTSRSVEAAYQMFVGCFSVGTGHVWRHGLLSPLEPVGVH
jgi:hypothetical protein